MCSWRDMSTAWCVHISVILTVLTWWSFSYKHSDWSCYNSNKIWCILQADCRTLDWHFAEALCCRLTRLWAHCLVSFRLGFPWTDLHHICWSCSPCQQNYLPWTLGELFQDCRSFCAGDTVRLWLIRSRTYADSDKISINCHWITMRWPHWNARCLMQRPTCCKDDLPEASMAAIAQQGEKKLSFGCPSLTRQWGHESTC